MHTRARGRIWRVGLWLGAALPLIVAPGVAAEIRIRGRIAPPPGTSLAAIHALRVGVVDAAGRNETELARRRFTAGADPAPLRTVRPDAGGAFELRVPESGFYRVQVEAAGFLTLACELFPLLEDRELPAAELAPAGTPLAVTVLDAGGQPAPGVMVGVAGTGAGASPRAWRRLVPGGDQHARRAGIAGDGGLSSAGAWHAAWRAGVTDTAGTIVLPRARGEAVELRATAHGWPQTSEVPAGAATTTLHLVSRPLRSLAVRHAGGTPAGGALVRRDSRWIGLTAEDGRLSIALPAADDVTLTVESEDGEVGEVACCAARGAAPGDLVVTLRPPRLLAGRVIDATTRQPLRGALVLGSLGPPLRTAADGGFRLPSPERGEARVQAFAAGYLALATSRPQAGQEGPGRPQAGHEGPAVLPLERAARLAGRVVDEAGRPVAGAEVVAEVRFLRQHQAHSEVKTRSRADGGFELAEIVAAEAYTVTADAEGFAPTAVVTRTAGGRQPAGRAGGPEIAARPAPPAAAAGPAAPALPDPTSLLLVLRAGASAVGRVADAEGRPVAGAEVELQRMGWPPRRLPREGLYSTQTGDTGAFLLSHLPPDRYQLSVLHPGFAPAQTVGIDLAAGASRSDLGTVILLPGTAISGRVVDGRDQPVAGARASLTLTRGLRAVSWESAADHAFSPSLETGEDGAFRFPDLLPGDAFELQVAKTGYLPVSEHRVAAPTREPLRIELRAAKTLEGRVLDADGGPVAGAQVIDLRANVAAFNGSSWRSVTNGSSATDAEGRFTLGNLAPGRLDLQVNARGYPIRQVPGVMIPDQGDPERLDIVLPRGALLEGRVAHEDGTPVAGAQLAAVPRAVERVLGLWADGNATNGVADGDGRYQLQGLATGTYAVTASGGDGEQAAAEIEVTAGDNHLDLTAKGGSEVSGAVGDGDGLPVEEALLTLTDAVSHEARLVTSGADGSFRFPRVADGTYNLTARKTGYFGATTSPPLRVAGQPLRGVWLQLRAAGATLTGKLLGLPAARRPALRITALSTTPNDETGATAVPLAAEGFAGLDGTYRVAGLAPGEWQVEAATDSGERAHGTVLIGAETREAAMDLDFLQGSTVSGRVLVDQRPLAAAMVGIQSADRGQDDHGEAATDHDGRFSIGNVAPGPHTLLIADGTNGIGHSQQVEVGAGGDAVTEISVALETGAVNGHVTLPDGSPLGGVGVQLERPDAAVFGSFPGPRLVTDDGGGFAVPHLLAGGWQVTVTRDGTLLAESRLEVRPHQTSVLEIVTRTAAAGASPQR